MATNTTENCKEMMVTCPLWLCILGLMGLCSWMIWHGNELRIENEAFKPGIAFEADCTILHRTLKKCDADWKCSGSSRYSYLANSTVCPNSTLSSARKDMKTWLRVNDVHTCYIDSCASGKFIFDYRPNERGPYTFIVIGSVIAAHCACIVCWLMILLCAECCKVIYGAFKGKKTATPVYDVVNNNGQNTAKSEYASKAKIEWATRLPGPYKPYDVVSKDDETDIEMEPTTHGQEGGVATTTR